MSVRGQPAVVVMSRAHSRRLQQQATSFIEFLQSSPLGEAELDLTRDGSHPRDERLEGPRKERLRTWLDLALPERFGARLLPVSARVAERWGRLLVESGRSLPAARSAGGRAALPTRPSPIDPRGGEVGSMGRAVHNRRTCAEKEAPMWTLDRSAPKRPAELSFNSDLLNQAQALGIDRQEDR